LGAIVLLVGAVSYRLSVSWTQRHIAFAQTTVTPFVLTYSDHTVSSAAKKDTTVARLFAQRSDGAIATVGGHYALPGQGNVVRRIILPNGLDVEINEVLKLKTTHQATIEQLARRKSKIAPDPKAQCAVALDPTAVSREAQMTVEGQETVLGTLVFKVVLNHWRQGVSPGQRITEWRSAELGCKDLKRYVEEVDSNGVVQSTIESNPISLTRGEPDPKSFVIPDYPEVPPSVMNTKWGEYFGVTCSECAQGWAQLDKIYYESRKNPPLN
jgi:hypothetical protein